MSLWLIKLQDDGRGYSTIHTVRGVVRPAFQMAVDDDLIRKNPFEFQLNTKPKVEPMIDGRHTYCSNMAKTGMNPKTLQYHMGHSDIGVNF